MSNQLELKVIISAIDKFARPMKHITEASRTASKALNDAKASMKGLTDQQKLIDKFKSTNKSLGINGQDMEKARAYAKKLGEELQRTEKPTAAMQKAFKHATDEARNLAGTVNRMREQKQRLRQEMVALGIDTKSLASHQKDLKGKLDAATSAVVHQEDVLKKARKNQQQMYAAQATADKIRGFGSRAGSGGRAALAGGAAIGAAGAIPVMAYARSEDASTQLQIALMEKGGKVSAQYEQIDALAKKLGTNLPGTTVDFQNMMTMLIRQGAEAKNVLGGLGEATANIGVLLKMSPEAAAEFSQQLQDATRTTNQDMLGLMDTIQRTYNVGTKQDWMLQAFSKLSPALSVIKKEGLEAANAMAPLLAMANQNGMTDGGSAGNALRKIFQQSMSKDKREKGNAELKGTGIALDFSNGNGEFGGLDKMFAQLEKLRSVSTEKRLAAIKATFGDDAETLQVLNLMIEKGASGYAEMLAKLEKQANIQERLEKQKKTLTALWETASGTFSGVLVKFGESISPELHATAEWLGKVAERVQKWADENPGLSSTLMKVLTVTGGLALGVGALGLAAGVISIPLAAMQTGLAALGLTQVVSSVGLMAAKLGALGLAFGVGYAAGSIFNDWLDKAISKVVGYDTSLGGLIYDLVQKFKETDWSLLGQWIVEGIEKGLDSLTFGLYSKIHELASGIATAAKEALGIKSPSRVFAEIGGYTMQGLEQGIDGAQRGPLDAVSGVAKKVAAIGAGAAIFSGGALASPATLDYRPPIAQTAREGNASGGHTFIFNIHPAQGMDERALAEAIRNQFVRFSSEQAARSRSRLRDLE